MIVLEYMAKFTELACFVDDYVATNMAKVRKFEGGLKLSIRGKIMGLLLQDLDLMVKKTIAIEREVDDARRSGMRVLKIRGRRANLLLARERSRGLLIRKAFRDKALATKAKAMINHPKMGDTLGLLASQGRGHVSIATNLGT